MEEDQQQQSSSAYYYDNYNNKRKRDTPSSSSSSSSTSSPPSISAVPPKKQYLTTSNNSNSTHIHNNNNNNTSTTTTTTIPEEFQKFAVDPFILQTQKRGLLLRLEEQRHELTSLRNKLHSVEEKQYTYEHTLSNVNHAWDQLNLDLNLSLGRVYHEDYDIQLDLSTLINDANGASNSKSFIKLLLESTKSDSGVTFEQIEIARSLQRKVDDTKQVMLKLVKAIEREKSANESLSKTLHQDTDTKLHSVIEENKALRKQNELHKYEIEQLHVQIREIHTKYGRYSDANAILEAKINEMQGQFLDFQEKLELANRKLKKQELKSAEDTEKLKQSLSEALAASAMPVNAQVKREIASPRERSPEPKEPGESDDELSELRSLASMRLEAINRMQQERVELIKEAEKWKREATHITDEQVQHSTLYQFLSEQNMRLKQDLETARTYADQLGKQFKDYKGDQMLKRERLAKEESDKREQLDRELRDADAEIANLREEKENLKHKMEIKEASSPSIRVLQELQAALSSRDIELKRLKEQCDRLKEDNLKLKTWRDDNKKGQESMTSILDTKAMEIEDLQAKLAAFSATIEDFKAKKRKSEEKEHELKLIIETLQSQVKDKRELRDVRLSEKKLQEANASLHEQLEKYEKSGAPQQLKEIEDKYELELDQLKKENSIQQIKAEKTIKKLELSLETQRQEMEGYISEIEVIGKAFEEQQEQNSRLLQQLAEKEDTLTKLMAEQIKSNQLQAMLREENKILSDKYDRVEDKTKILEDSLHKNEAKNKLTQEHLKKQTEELKTIGSLVEGLKRSQREHSDLSTEYRAKYERLHTEFSSLKQELELKDKSVATKDNQLSKLEEELASVRRKLERLLSRGTLSAVDALAEEELRTYKQKVFCGVCNDKQKSVVIARCYHTFCKPCIQKNLEVRSRKCPACGEKFAESDVHNIYF